MSRSSPDIADDPTASAEWNNGCDFAMIQLCHFLGVDQHSVHWDAATETVDGDVQAVIGNILRAKFGDDWGPANARSSAGIEGPGGSLSDKAWEALKEAIDVFEGMNDDEINVELLPRLVAVYKGRDLAAYGHGQNRDKTREEVETALADASQKTITRNLNHLDRCADLTDAQLDDLRSHIRGAQPGQGTYEYELGSGWRCFHCGEMFRTWGGASLHFGNPADKRPTCAPCPSDPAQPPAEPSDEWCDAFLKATDEWVEPHEPEMECGVPMECEITQEFADELNADARKQIRKGYAAACSISSTKRRGSCQVCGETANLKCGPSRFGNETWACKDCWQPEEEVQRLAGQKRIHDREESQHAVAEMHKGGEP